jgi:general secretion pathway protein M
MKLPALNNRQHALLSWAILLMLMTLIVAIFIAPAVILRQDLNGRIGELELQLNKFKTAGQGLEQLQQQIDRMNKAHANTGDFLEEKLPALAAADLQHYIKGVIETHQGSLVSAQPVSETSQELFPKVTVKIHLRGNITTLQQALYQLESSRPRLFLDNVVIQKRNPVATRTNQKDADLLEVRLDVSGYVFSNTL